MKRTGCRDRLLPHIAFSNVPPPPRFHCCPVTGATPAQSLLILSPRPGPWVRVTPHGCSVGISKPVWHCALYHGAPVADGRVHPQE
ncbi:hypothetical protein GCM10017562_75960 [Streptomyces roseofulvus]